MSTCLSFARASQSFVVSGGLWWPSSSLRELPTLPRWEFFPGQSLTHPHASFVTWDLGEGEKQQPEARCAARTWEGNTQSSSVAVGRGRGGWWGRTCPVLQLRPPQAGAGEQEKADEQL